MIQIACDAILRLRRDVFVSEVCKLFHLKTVLYSCAVSAVNEEFGLNGFVRVCSGLKFKEISTPVLKVLLCSKIGKAVRQAEEL